MFYNTDQLFQGLKSVFQFCIETIISSRDCMTISNRELVEKHFAKFITKKQAYESTFIKYDELAEEVKNATEFLEKFDFENETIIIKAMIRQIENCLTYKYFK